MSITHGAVNRLLRAGVNMLNVLHAATRNRGMEPAAGASPAPVGSGWPPSGFQAPRYHSYALRTQTERSLMLRPPPPPTVPPGPPVGRP
ncbi:hypothetical protein GCM10027168_62760 [Streptomyces capparidis]